MYVYATAQIFDRMHNFTRIRTDHTLGIRTDSIDVEWFIGSHFVSLVWCENNVDFVKRQA